jgi:hypothetical protein
MAIDYLSIPPQSAEAERAFSGARRTQSFDRLSMTPQNLEMIECIGNWLRNGIIDQKTFIHVRQSDDNDMEGDSDDLELLN